MNIFIAGLSYSITDADLLDLFQEFGEVSSAKVIMDRETRKSKGFGFVEMNDDEAAKKAIAELNNGEFDGRTISVSEAKPREPRPARPYNNRREGGYNSNRREGGYNREGGDRRNSNRY